MQAMNAISVKHIRGSAWIPQVSDSTLYFDAATKVEKGVTVFGNMAVTI
jgi:hypothetical protein